MFWEQKDIMCLQHCQMCMIYSSACLVPFVLAGFLSSTHLSHVADPECWQNDAHECLLGGVVVWSLAKDTKPWRDLIVKLCLWGQRGKKKAAEKTCGAWIFWRSQMYSKKPPKQWICLCPHNIWNVLFFFCSLGVFSVRLILVPCHDTTF